MNKQTTETWLSRSDIYRLEDGRRLCHNSKLRAQQFSAKLTNIITRFPRHVAYFGDWHK